MMRLPGLALRTLPTYLGTYVVSCAIVLSSI